MKKETTVPIVFRSVSQLHRALGQPAPLHPLISIINYAGVQADTAQLQQALVMDMYKISFKFSFSGKVHYGQQYYDFEEGGLSFFAPGQVISQAEDEADYSGYTLIVHPDLLRSYPLGKAIKNYGFFLYAVHEALCLSENERVTISGIFESIKSELHNSIDHFSQDIIISQIEQLLSYANRFYNRQFITRKAAHNDLLSQMEALLAGYFDEGKPLVQGLPTVQFIAGSLRVSPRYLSDMLKQLTGQTAQQHLHNHIIMRAKEALAGGNLTTGEVAYSLGFEHPQSFNKLFKRKTGVQPQEYKA